MDSSVRKSQASPLKTNAKSPRGKSRLSTQPGQYQSHSQRSPRKQSETSLTRADVEAAFAFFDVQNKKELKPRDLKVRLSAFYPEMSNTEFKFLLDESGGGSFTVDSLWNIIENFHGLQAASSSMSLISTTAVAENLRFDPVKEAFRIYDPNGTGVVDVEVLANIMKRIGLGDLSKEEIELLIHTADFDKDGKINLEDFRNLLKMGR